MENIGRINNDIPGFTNNKPRKTDSTCSTFQQTFCKVLKDLEPSEIDCVQPKGLAELSPKNFILPDKSDSINIADKTDRLLALLELYSSKLENSTISLREIDPVLKKINRDAGNLLDKIENSPGADEKIKNIAKELVLFANAEQIKFQRGDYLS